MKTARDIIQLAYNEAGITGDGQAASGTQLERGLQFLNDNISEYNLDDYLKFTQKVYTFNSNSKVFIFTSDPDFALAADDYRYQLDSSPVIIQLEPPVRVNNMAFENGVQYINMISTGFEDLQKYIMQATNSTPSFYSYVRDGETGTIFIDRSTARKLRITYNSSIPEMTVDTIIKIPPEYISLLYMELAVSLMEFYNMDDEDIAKKQRKVDARLNSIKERNKHTHTITYDETEYGQSNFYNILSPRQWA